MKIRRPLAVSAAAAVLGLTLSSAVYSCFPRQHDSIHFNSTMPDFAAPPPAWELYGWKEQPSGRTSRRYGGYWQADQALEREAKELALLINRARCEEQCGHFDAALSLYLEIKEKPGANIAFCVDRIELLGNTVGMDEQLLKAYLSATAATEIPSEVSPETLAKSQRTLLELYGNKAAGRLRAHALYAYAAAVTGDAMDRSHLYERVAREFPRSARAESALIMAARLPLEEKESWMTGTYDRARVARSRAMVTELLCRYPKTRFRANALGWAARADYVMGRYAAAEKMYIRQLAARPSEVDRFRAYQSIAVCRKQMGDLPGTFIAWLAHATVANVSENYISPFIEMDELRDHFSGNDAEVLGKRLLERPDLIAAYLDYRLYLSTVRQSEVRSLLSFVDQVFRKHGDDPVGAALCARLAELHYLSGKPSQAISWARRALAKGRNISDRADLALYVEGAVLRRKGSYVRAIASLTKLVRQYPDSYLVIGAKENLALAYEATRRLDKALDLYFELKYDTDIAYLLDVRMSTPEVRRYAESRRASFTKPYDVYVSYEPRTVPYTYGEVVRYSLGIRLLRDMKLEKAREVFQTFPKDKLLTLASPGYVRWQGEPHNMKRNPLNTIHSLKHWQKGIKGARTYEEKAEAHYALAAYIYNNRDLLFYNWPLWEGSREYMVGYYYSQAIAKPADTRALREHCYAHECLNRSRVLFLDVAKKWPKSRVTPKALYSAACATERLSNMSTWWRAEDDRVDLSSRAISLMKTVATEYPNHELAHDAAKYAEVWTASPNW